ncbi:MAG: response regulator [Eubacterium sp.]|nr:response regulator [Eubacterium sp.]
MIKIVAVDDEKIALEGLMSSIKKAIPGSEPIGFRNPAKALDHVRDNGCDIAFLDIEMRTMNGIEAAEGLKKINPRINVIFTTGYGDYAGEAFDVHASGYIMKPVTVDKIKKEMENLRYPLADSSAPRLKAQTFGNFEVFLDDEPLKFQYSKTKELLAYLIDRNGAMCSNQEIISILWEDDEDSDTGHNSYLKNIRSDLTSVLENAGCLDAIARQRGLMGVVPSRISCDYFDYLNGDKDSRSGFRGEYMSQYSWGEYTLGSLL